MNYTDSAKRTLRGAEAAAKENGSGYVGTEHLLIGLLREDSGVASQVLENNGVTEDKLRDMIASLRVEKGETAVADRGGYTPRLQSILEGAQEQAKRFHSDTVGTEHLLLALILERQNVALKLMEAAGANIAKIYFETIAALGEDPAKHRNDLAFMQQAQNASAQGGRSILEQYSRDLTNMAREGLLDPVIGRDTEMQRVIQILSRQHKEQSLPYR